MLRHRSTIPALVLLLLSACGAAEPPVLSVGDVGYTEIDLGLLSAEQREQLATLTGFGVIVSRDELARLAEPFIERAVSARLLRRLSEEVSLRESGVGDAQLREAYDADPEYELVVRHLVILSERNRPDEHREAARERAAEALRAIEGGTDFAAVAAEYSEEPGAAIRGGLLEPGRRGTWVREFWEAAAALEPGGVSGVVESPYGFHVLKLEDRRVLPFAEVREQVLGRLVDFAELAPAADAWASREAEPLQLDPTAVLAWRDGEIGDDVTLATWPGGSYRGAEFRRYLITLNAENAERIEAAEPEEYLAIASAIARNALLSKRAEELGIELPGSEMSEMEEVELTRLRALAGALNFQRGASTAAIKSAAIRALSPSNQRALIARSELLELAPAIRYLYPGRVAEAD